MSTFTNVVTDKLYVTESVNDFSIDWGNILYTSTFLQFLKDSEFVEAKSLRLGKNNKLKLKVRDDADDYDLVFPKEQGPAGSSLLNDGLGNLNWSTPDGGGLIDASHTVGNITATTTLTTDSPVNLLLSVTDDMVITLPESKNNEVSMFNIVIKDYVDAKIVTLNTVNGNTIDNDVKNNFVLRYKHQKITVKTFGYGVWYTC
jgi:hypothetical protein